ncbi:hypothetical protein M2273_003551 [Mucilaginibacter lappiensis]
MDVILTTRVVERALYVLSFKWNFIATPTEDS